MNNFLKYPLTNKNRIIKFKDIKGIKLGGFVSNSNKQVHLYRNTGTKTYNQINGTNFSALKDELVPLIIDFDNDFTNKPGPVIRFTIDANNTQDDSDDIYSNYYFDIKDKIVMVVNGLCYNPDRGYGVRLETVIPESIILRSGEELEFVKYGTFVFYKNDNTEILVSTEANMHYANLYFNVTATSEQENIIGISFNWRWMRIGNNYNEFIISSEEHYNVPSEEGEEEEEGN